MSIFLFIAFIISTFYVVLIAYIYHGWKITKDFMPINVPALSVTVLIPVRNESGCINHCISSILNNNFPLDQFEILVIDDHSDDDTLKIIQSIAHPNLRVLSLDGSTFGKKSAITFGVANAKFPLIICTDADCIVGENWLLSHVQTFQDDSIKISTGLVIPEVKNTVLSAFQWMDFASTMAITASGITRKEYYLANGANISYLKTTFETVSGYLGNEKYSSGDDLFLIQKVAKANKNGVRFLKSTQSMVITKSETSWKNLFSQRKRWATKSVALGDRGIVSIQAFIFIFVLLIVVGIILGAIFLPMLLVASLLALVIKMATDFIFLFLLSAYFKQRKVMNYFPACFVVYFIHIIMSGWFALFPTRFEWKTRNVQ